MEWPFEEGGRTERAHAARDPRQWPRGVHVCWETILLLIFAWSEDAEFTVSLPLWHAGGHHTGIPLLHAPATVHAKHAGPRQVLLYFRIPYSRISTLVLPTAIPGPASVQELSDHL